MSGRYRVLNEFNCKIWLKSRFESTVVIEVKWGKNKEKSMVLGGEIGIGNEVWEMKRLGEKAEKQDP